MAIGAQECHVIQPRDLFGAELKKRLQMVNLEASFAQFRWESFRGGSASFANKTVVSCQDDTLLCFHEGSLSLS